MLGYKLFSIKSPGADPEEFLFEEDQNEIILGEAGRGRKATTIPVAGQGDFFRPKRVGADIVLVRVVAGEGAPAHCLVIVNAVGGYDRYRNFDVHEVANLEEIARGWCAFGAAGRTNGGPVVLGIAKPGAEFRLNSKYASHWYQWDGYQWALESPSVRAAGLALAEVEAGGGEWL